MSACQLNPLCATRLDESGLAEATSTGYYSFGWLESCTRSYTIAWTQDTTPPDAPALKNALA